MAKSAKEASEATELLGELLHAHKRTVMALARDYGLTPQQSAVLWWLTPEQTLPMSALADYLMCDASNVTGIVDKLESRGLAQREQGEDRRVKVLRLTTEGDALRSEMRKKLLEPPPWITALPREDQRALRDLLLKLVEGMRAHGDK